MNKLNFDVYSDKDVQTFFSFLSQAEKDGITDVQVLYNTVKEKVDALSAQHKQGLNILKANVCPECGRSSLIPVLNNEGLHILGCSECRYSTHRE